MAIPARRRPSGKDYTIFRHMKHIFDACISDMQEALILRENLSFRHFLTTSGLSWGRGLLLKLPSRASFCVTLVGAHAHSNSVHDTGIWNGHAPEVQKGARVICLQK